jgi:hypothetical protein
MAITMKKFIKKYHDLYLKHVGIKPSLNGYFFHRVKDCYEKCFYECPDVMLEVLTEYFNSDIAEKKGYSWQYLLWWNPEKKEYSVALDLLEKVRDNMKRSRKWEISYEMPNLRTTN